MTIHQLYRHFDQHGYLLYVGQSISALARLMSHKSSPWIADIAFVSIDRYESPDALNEAEAVAIAMEAPIYNKVQPQVQKEKPDAQAPSQPKSAPAPRSVSRRDLAQSQPEVAIRSDVSGSARAEPLKSPRGPAASRHVKRGRPRLEDVDKTLEATKPWKAAGMSKRTWQRRQAEKKS